ncbi:hypothetical protein BOO69_14120 [Sulfitobacter alexandrii]|uniref:Uncharacterized protein n=1 Tax=Sulfitobacter alexandrii TaxID=1917485 RepID=A0A1J0WJD4_9RHOB|nr:hypothetical protein BOO69_14120 [Sulfitobacter alexandrii]
MNAHPCNEDTQWVAIELTRCGAADRWLLEITDGNGKSITWPDYFSTSEAALKAAEQIIDRWDAVHLAEVRSGTSPLVHLVRTDVNMKLR